eukprot:scaffold5664_cov115-Isochrysis_galbana.AAC.5
MSIKRRPAIPDPPSRSHQWGSRDHARGPRDASTAEYPQRPVPGSATIVSASERHRVLPLSCPAGLRGAAGASHAPHPPPAV